jgi:hypothetical protein
LIKMKLMKTESIAVWVWQNVRYLWSDTYIIHGRIGSNVVRRVRSKQSTNPSAPNKLSTRGPKRSFDFQYNDKWYYIVMIDNTLNFSSFFG